jgi:hypothetical protein
VKEETTSLSLAGILSFVYSWAAFGGYLLRICEESIFFVGTYTSFIAEEKRRENRGSPLGLLLVI